MDKKMGKYIDLHCHTCKSDGVETPERLIELAIENEIGVLAITDHNERMSQQEFDALQKKYEGKIRLIQGSEVSMLYADEERGISSREIHVVVLFNDANCMEFLNNYKMDREGYYNAIRDALSKWNVFIPVYQEMLKQYPKTTHLGRKHIADWMHKHGCVETVDDAFDIYIGGFGERKAFVDSAAFRSGYGKMEDIIAEIIEKGGDSVIAIILAHPFYYRLEGEGLFQLIRKFKKTAGDLAGMETLYRRYDDAQRQYLKELAEGKLGEDVILLQSAGSDYHGQSETDSLYNEFPMENWEAIEANYNKKR